LEALAGHRFFAYEGRIGGKTRIVVKKRKPLVADALSPVYLVGAGPGDPELLTLKALRLLGEADVVVYDRLVSEEVLALIPSGATRIFAGKVARHHYMPQTEINELLVGLARSGRKVVRLKGGDPFVFGRGGEEAARLAESGIPFEVVPGVTSASGCSAYAGIPLTHRGLAHSVRYVAGYTQKGEIIELNWASLADPDTTLVVYMGRTNVRRLGEQLIAHGLSAETPAAAILNGTRPNQRTVVTTLKFLADRVEALNVAAPTLLVIGRVVSLAEVLAWYAPDSADHDDPGTSKVP
jgi:uroporphyrin-III C-methyltransferase/precorrin-2 dehydrogenase/sirohydrochlorin ferrochelatase/uroporphyrin-III C-methyltransferase